MISQRTIWYIPWVCLNTACILRYFPFQSQRLAHCLNSVGYSVDKLLYSWKAAQKTMDWWQEGGWLALYIPGRGFLPGSLLLGLPDCWESANTQKEGPEISSKRRQQRLAESEIFSRQRWLFPAKKHERSNHATWKLRNYANRLYFCFFLL